MPRKARIDIPGILQHVIGRGIERRVIYKDDKDREYFLEQLADVLMKNKGQCYGWVLMPNHFHLVLVSGKEGLSRIMRQLLTRYAVYFNHRHKRSGHLFQNRYKSVACEEDTYLLELVRYIHLNPLRAGMVKDLKELSDYPWSGHRTLIGKENRSWQARDEVLSYFGNKEKEAIKRYRQYIEEGVGQKKDYSSGGLIRSLGGLSEVMRDMKSGYRQMYDDRILGSGGFVEGLLKEQDAKEKIQNRLSKKISTLKDLINLIAKKLVVEVMELKGNRRGEKIAKARALISYIGQRYLGEQGVAIGLELNKSSASISIAYNRGKKIIEENAGAKSILDDILTT